MTRVEFYFNVADKQKLVTSLVAHALAKHRKVSIFAHELADATEISAYLWQNQPASFLPNVLANHVSAAATPVVIACKKNAKGEMDAIIQDDLMINLTTNHPSFFSRFTHLVEVVGNDEPDKMSARQRYKFYRDRGYEIKHNDHAKLNNANVE